MRRTLGASRRSRWAAAGPGVAVRTEVALGPDGSDAAIVISGDDAITLVLDEGTFAPHGDDRSVLVRATPRATGSMRSAIHPLAFFGKAVEIDATYRPSGDPASPLAPIQVILSYVETPSLRADAHELAYSSDGSTWRPLDSRDAGDLQQVEADLEELGYVAVVGEPSTPVPAGSAAPPSGGPSLTVWLLIATAALMFVAGVALILRGARVRR